MQAKIQKITVTGTFHLCRKKGGKKGKKEKKGEKRCQVPFSYPGMTTCVQPLPAAATMRKIIVKRYS